MGKRRPPVFTYREKYLVQVPDEGAGEVLVEIDVAAIAGRMGRRAILSRSGRSTAANGAIRVTRQGGA